MGYTLNKIMPQCFNFKGEREWMNILLLNIKKEIVRKIFLKILKMRVLVIQRQAQIAQVSIRNIIV